MRLRASALLLVLVLLAGFAAADELCGASCRSAAPAHQMDTQAHSAANHAHHHGATTNETSTEECKAQAPCRFTVQAASAFLPTDHHFSIIQSEAVAAVEASSLTDSIPADISRSPAPSLVCRSVPLRI